MGVKVKVGCETFYYGLFGDFKLIIDKSTGYFNATKLCTEGGKNYFHWTRLEKSKKMVEYYQRNWPPHVEANFLYEVKDANKDKIGKQVTGTYVPKELILVSPMLQRSIATSPTLRCTQDIGHIIYYGNPKIIKMFFIIHETSTDKLMSILKNEMLYRCSKIQSLGLACGQGSKNRRLASDPLISLTDPNFDTLYDEVDGVYFRLLRVETPIQTHHGGNCVLVFSHQLLDSYSFVLNTEENFGFCIAEEGKEAESQFSGEPGISIFTLEKLKLLENYNFNPYSSEIVVTANVNLKNLKSVFVKESHQNKHIIDMCRTKNIEVYTI